MPDNIIITIDGKVQKDIERDLIEVVVDTNLYLPAMFSITLNDDFDDNLKLVYADSDTFKIGAEVKIEVETDEIPEESSPVKATVFVGEITAIEPVFESSGVPLFRIRGYDRLHWLTRGRKTRTFGDANPTGSGIADQQIINTIVGETKGLTSAEVDTSGLSSLKYPYLLQYNQTDLEFLWSRARLLGYQVYVEEKKLYFQKADAHRGSDSDKPAKLYWPLNLSSFEPRQSVMYQVDEAIVKGWDPNTKAAIEGKATSDSSSLFPKIGLTKRGGAQAKESFDVAQDVGVDTPVYTLDEAKVLAQAKFTAAESVYVQAEGVCRQGDPRLIAGRLVTVDGVGERFSGDYYVSEARHVYSGGSYQVTFSVTGRQVNTVSDLVGTGASGDTRAIGGVVTAKVTNLEDPEELGRVQVMFPWLPKYKDADLSSNWARLASPMAGKERGMFFTPEVDDEVLVAFEHGDPSHPYIVGVLWNAKDTPPAGTKAILASGGKQVDQRVIRSRSGHLIILDDTDGEEQIIVQDKTEKNSIVISSKENTMTILSDGDMTFSAQGNITIDAGGTLTVTSQKDMSLDSKAKGTIKTMSDMALTATGNAESKGMQTTIQGTAKTEVKAAQVSISGDAQTEVKSSGILQIQGSLVKIN
ncbi:MAG: VgrG-related protein [Anaerolineae bacterium]|nr:VgrG-related protein [Anaerolineae bacterium]